MYILWILHNKGKLKSYNMKKNLSQKLNIVREDGECSYHKIVSITLFLRKYLKSLERECWYLIVARRDYFSSLSPSFWHELNYFFLVS